MRLVLVLLALLALPLGACGDDTKPAPDAAPTLETPETLPRPPTGGLPADLRPPR